MYVHFFMITENENFCDLIPKEDTVTIGNFSFGSVPTSDTCSSITLRCEVEETPGITINELPRWFELDQDTTLFYLTKEPLEYLTIRDEIFFTQIYPYFVLIF